MALWATGILFFWGLLPIFEQNSLTIVHFTSLYKINESPKRKQNFTYKCPSKAKIYVFEWLIRSIKNENTYTTSVSSVENFIWCIKNIRCPWLTLISVFRRDRADMKSLTLQHTIPTFNDPKEERFGKHHGRLWKGENFNQNFILFPKMFSTLSRGEIIILTTPILLSANAFNLDQAKVLLFGKELTHYQTTKFCTGPNWNKQQTTFLRAFKMKNECLIG